MLGSAPEVEQLALAKAISITQRLNSGEDFATLAQQFSDDTGSGAQGGELGFFGRGQMVKEFEDAAFSLPIGQISEPVKSQFGYHIIRVEEKDNGKPDITLWLQEQKASAQIKRSLTPSRLGTLPTVSPELLQSPVSAAPAALPQAPVGVTPAPIENTEIRSRPDYEWRKCNANQKRSVCGALFESCFSCRRGPLIFDWQSVRRGSAAPP